MNEQIERMRAAIAREEERIAALQQAVKEKKERLKEKETLALQSSLNVIAARGGISVADIVEAIQRNDTTLLLSLAQNEQTGSASDFSGEKNKKEEL